MNKKMIIILTIIITLTMGIITIKKDNKNHLEEDIELKGIYLSYIDIENNYKGKNPEEMRKETSTILDNIASLNLNTVIIQVRSFSDAIYPSEIYPMSRVLVSKEGYELGFDFLEDFIEQAKSQKIKIFLWLNPYRISNKTDTSVISIYNPAYKWLNTDHVKVIDSTGIFYNPASKEVQELILKGIKELLENYDFEALIYDDYFYPDKTIDNETYQVFLEQGGEKDINDYRIDNVTSLIEETSKLVHSYNKKFGLSPSGNIENNLEEEYLDIKKILALENCLDYIMPQLYYGFTNETKPFLKTLEEWEKININNIELIPSLAFYKVGKEDKYAKSGSTEWINTTNVIAKQIVASQTSKDYKGFSLFRYDFIFSKEYENENTQKEITAMKEVMFP